jgi:hypothetical protein
MQFCYFLLHYYITLIDIHKNAFLIHSIYAIAVNVIILYYNNIYYITCVNFESGLEGNYLPID